MESNLIRTYVEVFDKEKEKNVTVPVILGVRCVLDDRPTNFEGFSLAETDTGKLVEVAPTTIFYSARHKTVSISRPPRPKRYKSGAIMYGDRKLPMCDNPTKTSMTLTNFKRTHGDKFVKKIVGEIMACLDT